MINEQLKKYIDDIQPVRRDIYTELEEIATIEKIPIIVPDSGYFLQLLCMLHKPKNILEVGTAIGYSTLWFLDNTDAFVDTIEIDSTRVHRSQELFEKMNYESRVKVHEGDANDILPTMVGKSSFDFIFIDAAKGQYINYFQYIEDLTVQGAVVVTDNVFFHGMVPGISEPSKKLEPLVNKIREFNQMLHDNDRWYTTFYSIGDGLAVSIKR